MYLDFLSNTCGAVEMVKCDVMDDVVGVEFHENTNFM